MDDCFSGSRCAYGTYNKRLSMTEYKGIDRNEFMKWQGWGIVSDYEKIAHNETVLRQLCDNNIELQSLVTQFYQGVGNDSIRSA